MHIGKTNIGTDIQWILELINDAADSTSMLIEMHVKILCW
jgi:hypothetical protein